MMATRKKSGLGKGIEAYFPARQASPEQASAAGKPADSQAGTAGTGKEDKGSAPGKNNMASAAEQAAVMLRISLIEPNRSQPRKIFDEESLNELAESVRKYGILQPIIVQDLGGRYEIIAGERRYRAARMAGLKEIPAVVRSYSNDKVIELSLIENIQRENLNPIEEAAAYKRLSDEFGLKQEEISDRVFKSRAAIANSLRLLKLSETVQQMVAGGSLSAGHARTLVTVSPLKEQDRLAGIIIDKGLSVREAEDLVRKYQEEVKKAKARAAKDNEDPASDREKRIIELAYKDMEERLISGLGSKVSIKQGKKGGKIEIAYADDNDLERLIGLIL